MYHTHAHMVRNEAKICQAQPPAGPRDDITTEAPHFSKKLDYSQLKRVSILE